jgi:hypothetical protein
LSVERSLEERRLIMWSSEAARNSKWRLKLGPKSEVALGRGSVSLRPSARRSAAMTSPVDSRKSDHLRAEPRNLCEPEVEGTSEARALATPPRMRRARR